MSQYWLQGIGYQLLSHDKYNFFLAYLYYFINPWVFVRPARRLKRQSSGNGKLIPTWFSPYFSVVFPVFLLFCVTPSHFPAQVFAMTVYFAMTVFGSRHCEQRAMNFVGRAKQSKFEPL
jgi:hypothetical protein